MSQEPNAVVTLSIVEDGRLRVVSLKTCVPPSGIIDLKDTAGRLLGSFYPSGAVQGIAGSPVEKPPDLSGPLGDTVKSRKVARLVADLDSILRASSLLPSIRERALVLCARLASELQLKAAGSTLRPEFSIEEQVASAKQRSADRP